MICLLALKKSVAGPLIIIPLPFITFIFMNAAYSRFWPPMDALSLLAASELDAAEELDSRAAGAAGEDSLDTTKLYLAPSFLLDAAAHASTLDNCKRMHAVLEGETDEQLFKLETVTSDSYEEVVDEMHLPTSSSAPSTSVPAPAAEPAVIKAEASPLGIEAV